MVFHWVSELNWPGEYQSRHRKGYTETEAWKESRGTRSPSFGELLDRLYWLLKRLEGN